MFSIAFGCLLSISGAFILRGSGYSLDSKDDENFRTSANHSTAVTFYDQLLAGKNIILLHSNILRSAILLLLVLLLPLPVVITGSGSNRTSNGNSNNTAVPSILLLIQLKPRRGLPSQQYYGTKPLSILDVSMRCGFRS